MVSAVDVSSLIVACTMNTWPSKSPPAPPQHPLLMILWHKRSCLAISSSVWELNNKIQITLSFDFCPTFCVCSSCYCSTFGQSILFILPTVCPIKTRNFLHKLHFRPILLPHAFVSISGSLNTSIFAQRLKCTRPKRLLLRSTQSATRRRYHLRRE